MIEAVGRTVCTDIISYTCSGTQQLAAGSFLMRREMIKSSKPVPGGPGEASLLAACTMHLPRGELVGHVSLARVLVPCRHRLEICIKRSGTDCVSDCCFLAALYMFLLVVAAGKGLITPHDDPCSRTR
jgi:hypothetical protein